MFEMLKKEEIQTENFFQAQLVNEELKKQIELLENSSTLGIFNPEDPFRNTPIELIDIDSVLSFCISENIILLNTHFESYTIYIDSDEKILKILKTVMKDVPFSLIDWEFLIVSLNGYQIQVDLKEMVYIHSLKNKILESQLDSRLMLANYSSASF